MSASWQVVLGSYGGATGSSSCKHLALGMLASIRKPRDESKCPRRRVAWTCLQRGVRQLPWHGRANITCDMTRSHRTCEKGYVRLTDPWHDDTAAVN